MNDCPWMRKDLKYELDIVALGKYVCACEERWWNKNVMSIFGRSMPNSQICQISFWSGRLFHSIRPTECQFNYSSRVAPKAFPNASESQEAKQAPYFCLPATIFTVIDRISTESRLFTSIHHFHDSQSFIWLNKRYNHIQLHEIINAIEFSVNSKILLKC